MAVEDGPRLGQLTGCQHSHDSNAGLARSSGVTRVRDTKTFVSEPVTLVPGVFARDSGPFWLAHPSIPVSSNSEQPLTGAAQTVGTADRRTRTDSESRSGTWSIRRSGEQMVASSFRLVQAVTQLPDAQ